MQLSTDGVPLYKSSSVSIWPVYFVILNLAAEIRMKAENIILCGTWVGPTKPKMNLLLEPIAKYVKQRSLFGEMVKLSEGYIKVWAKIVMGIFDLPAKASVLIMKQFNGKHGCSVCLHPGRRLRNNACVYLPSTEHSERTHVAIVAAAAEA